MKPIIPLIGLSAVLVCLIASAQTQPRAAGSGLAERFKQLDRNGESSAGERTGPQRELLAAIGASAEQKPQIEAQFQKHPAAFRDPEFRKALAAILTPEQQAKVRERLQAGMNGADRPSQESPESREAVQTDTRGFTVAFQAGAYDAARNYLGGTEIRVSVTHGGKLYVGNNYWMDQSGKDPMPGPAIFALDSRIGKWRVEHEFAERLSDGTRRSMGISALESVTFCSDAAGKPLPRPVSMLLAGTWVSTGDAIVASRDESNGRWTEMALPAAEAANALEAQTRQQTGARGFAGMTFGSAETRCVLVHRDAVTGVDRIFAGVRPAGVYSGAYDASAPGRIRWEPRPELETPPGDFFRNTERIMGFTECNGQLHVVVGRSIYRRSDGPRPKWEKVYTNSDGRSVMTGLRGPTAVPHPSGKGQALLVALEGTACRMIRLDPQNHYSAVVELDVLSLLDKEWGIRPAYAEAGMNHCGGGMTRIKDSASGQDFWLIGIGSQLGPGRPQHGTAGGRKTFFGLERGAWYLVRNTSGEYALRHIVDASDPVLIAPRTFCLSPFPEDDGNAIYIGGYDCWGKPAHNTGWMYRGTLDGVLGRAVLPPKPEATPARTQTSPGPFHLFWGDLHAHTTYSLDARASGCQSTPADALDYARKTARLDFCAITDHDYSMTREHWQAAQKQVNAADAPGTFVAFIGYEWTEARRYGHKQVIFRGTNVPDMVFGALNLPEGESVVRQTPQELWKSLAPYPSITIPHQVAQGVGFGERARPSQDWQFVNSAFQPVVEIFSKHGSSESAGTAQPIKSLIAERTVESALMRWIETADPGYQLGIVACTDDHRGRPGGVNDYAPPRSRELPFSGGLTAVYAPALTRESIFDAIKARRCYATSGPRIRLAVKVSAGQREATMGESLTLDGLDRVTLTVDAVGDTAPIAKVEVIGNGKVIVTKNEGQFSVELPVRGRTYFRVVAYQQETRAFGGSRVAERAWSSPIWSDVKSSAAPPQRTEEP